MNITFLIGNGFDVGIGMKSRFKDFFPIYQENSCKKEERIRKFSDVIGSDYDTWADFECALGQYTLKFNNETKQDFIAQVKDFENDFIEYLKHNEMTLVFDDEVGDLMVNALVQFYDSKNLAPESSAAIRKVYSTHGAENHTYNFINFNYTFTLEKCLKTISDDVVRTRRSGNVEKVDKIGQVVHVHGNCELYPIIGVNDKSQIANKELAEDGMFCRYIVKPLLNQFLRQGNDANTTNIINQSTIICVYGMALGETDKKWWNLLIKWLNGNSERQLVVYEYDNKYTTSTQFGWLEKEDLIINKLAQYSGVGNDIEKLRSRIHIAIHKNIFSMRLSMRSDEEMDQLYNEIIMDQMMNDVLG
ncbi:MAG: hypothetical protein IJE23_08115 [Tyzzerella sp.]|nr:hypothetical protein [Tyzzerella sp.]